MCCFKVILIYVVLSCSQKTFVVENQKKATGVKQTPPVLRASLLRSTGVLQAVVVCGLSHSRLCRLLYDHLFLVVTKISHNGKGCLPTAPHSRRAGDTSQSPRVDRGRQLPCRPQGPVCVPCPAYLHSFPGVLGRKPVGCPDALGGPQVAFTECFSAPSLAGPDLSNPGNVCGLGALRCGQGPAGLACTLLWTELPIFSLPEG